MLGPADGPHLAVSDSRPLQHLAQLAFGLELDRIRLLDDKKAPYGAYFVSAYRMEVKSQFPENKLSVSHEKSFALASGQPGIRHHKCGELHYVSPVERYANL